jgi:E3 ubiquitin-protein ligase HUWE1
MSVLVALCVDTSSGQEGKEISSDLVAVQKFVLESISRSIKDTPTESTERQYGRLFALSDLCYRLLTVRFNLASRKHEDSPTQISKVMLEKNFVATLTNALSDVDLNYPNIRTLVVAILKPLEFL